jgi:hypothetical protein
MIDLNQVKSDFENGVIVCRHTLDQVIDLALKLQQPMEVCGTCNNTGEADGLGYLNCPDCDCAMERAAFNSSLKSLPPMTEGDALWHAFQAGKHKRDEEVLSLVKTEK